MTVVGIIGTAGRGEQGSRLSAALYLRCLAYLTTPRALRGTTRMAPLVGPLDDVVSGGAAWMDHLAVSLFVRDEAASLTLYLPARLEHRGQVPPGTIYAPTTDSLFDPARVSNYYHRRFSTAMTGNSRDGFAAWSRGARLVEPRGPAEEGFKHRNLLVGRVQRPVALTFSDSGLPHDGGTRHTWDHSPAPEKIHVNLGEV